MRLLPRVLAVLAVLAGAPVAATEGEGDLRPGAAHGARRAYIVVLDDPPVAQYEGGIAGLAPTAIGTLEGLTATQLSARGAHLDLDTDASRAYLKYLAREQDEVIAAIRWIAPETEVGWRYFAVLNGFAADLTPRHAVEIAALAGVRTVYPSQELRYEMDSVATLVGAETAWAAVGGPDQAGLGARIAILDTGGDAVHPFMHDEGMPLPPEGFPTVTLHGRDGTVVTYPPDRIRQLTNDKLIGARLFDRVADQDGVNRRSPSALSGGSHGMHVSGIAAGRHGLYTVPLFGPDAYGVREAQLELSGIAPMAQVIVYRNWDATPGMVAAFEQMVRDEVDAVNLSLGTCSWLLDSPERHPIGMAAEAAADAGVVVVASAGNAAANGRASLSGSWKYSESVLAVGNTTSTGSFDMPLTVSGAAVPNELKSLVAAHRGSDVFTEPITAPLFLAPDGGCRETPLASGKIAVAERFDEAGSSIGACGYSTRSTRMYDSGAKAIVYVYHNRWLGGTSVTSLRLPGAALGRKGGAELVEFLRAGGVATGTVGVDIRRDYRNQIPDVLSPSSSLGPGLNWQIKPDISAPGTNIVSSVWGYDRESNAVGHFATMSGTSMAAPQVAGAAALIRSRHPTWSADEVRSTLITTSAPVVEVGLGADLRPARMSESGPGRLDLSRAAAPGAVLSPPELSFGAIEYPEPSRLAVTMRSVAQRPVLWRMGQERAGGDALLAGTGTPVLLWPGATVQFTVTLETAELEETEHWGHLVLSGTPARQVYLPSLARAGGLEEVEEAPPAPSAGGAGAPLRNAPRFEAAEEEAADYSLRLAYQAYVDNPDNRLDVMVVNWTYGDTPDYTRYYTETLEELGLTYSVWAMGEPSDAHPDRRLGHPTFEELKRHDLVILNANVSPVSLQEELRGQFQYQNLMVGGGSLLIAGQGTQDWWRYLGGPPLADTQDNRRTFPETFPYMWLGYSEDVGCEMCLARYFAGFTPRYTSTLSGRLLIPYPTPPDRPETQVVLEPHPEGEGIFDYALDISTGSLAPEGAAGNQYSFASGEVLTGYVPTTSFTLTRGLGDIADAELVLSRVAGRARPLWTYSVRGRETAVGTYVAGRLHDEAEIPWNAMFWGFGLEGVGAGAPGTVSRERLMGDVFNFLARDLYVDLAGGMSGPLTVRLRAVLPSGRQTRDPLISEVHVDWGDGLDEKGTFDPPGLASTIEMGHIYQAAGTYVVGVKLVPAPGERTAPLYSQATVAVE